MTTQPEMLRAGQPALNPDERSRQVAFILARVFQDVCRLPLPVRLRTWGDSVVRRPPESGGSTRQAERLAFEQGRMGVDQVLVTRSEGTHR
jgi:hypothetical protein